MKELKGDKMMKKVTLTALLGLLMMFTSGMALAEVYSYKVYDPKTNKTYTAEIRPTTLNAGGQKYYMPEFYTPQGKPLCFFGPDTNKNNQVLESFDITDDYLKQIKNSVFKAVSELQAFEQESIKKLQEQYSKLTTIISNGIKQKLSGELEIDNTTYNELMNKWQEEKREISSKIANLSESTRDTMTRMNILADFANRVPELYLKATLEEKRMILTTITDKILIDSDKETITVKLKPIFEYLRQIKLQNRQAFSSNIETLNGTLETRSERAKQGDKNIKPAINQIKDYGTRRMLLKTKIEPLDGSSMKFNVGDGT